MHERDLYNLAQTSKTIREKTQAQLFRNLDLVSSYTGHSDVAHERFLKSLVIKGQLSAPDHGVYPFVRNLTFSSFPHGHVILPLNFHNVADYAARRALQHREFHNLEAQLNFLLNYFPDGRLHAFK